MPSNHFILCHPLLLLPSIFPSIRVFSNESALHIRWPKYWSFSFNISPSNEHPGLISSGMDWLELLAVQGTLKSLLQHHSSKASILQCSAFFIVQLSHPYMTNGKTIALTRWTFMDKVMSPLFNLLSRLVITFLPRNKRLLISWLQSPSAVILEPRKIKSDTVSTVSPSICHEVMWLDAMILVFWMLSFKPTFSLSYFIFIKRLFSSSSLCATRVVSSAYLRLFVFLPAILIPACASSSPLSSNYCYYLPTKVHIVKAMVFPVVMYRCEGWTIKNAEHWKIDAFELRCWRKLFRVPWTERRSNQSMLKDITPEYSLERLMVEAEAPILWPPDTKSWLIGKAPDDRKDWRWEEKGVTKDEMVEWHHQLNGHESEWIPGDNEGREAGRAAAHGIMKNWTWLSDWTTNCYY